GSALGLCPRVDRGRGPRDGPGNPSGFPGPSFFRRNAGLAISSARHTAFLILFARSARARVITPDGRRLGRLANRDSFNPAPGFESLGVRTGNDSDLRSPILGLSQSTTLLKIFEELNDHLGYQRPGQVR